MSSLDNMQRVEVNPLKMDPDQRQKEAEFLKQASGDDLKELFHQYRQGGKSQEINMTEEEAKRIGDCFDKPEFMDMFREYVDDISDPKNMEEYDQYLRQLEEEGEIPDDEEVIRPEKGFVLKTKSADGSKIFINCCGTDRVPEPTKGKPADPSIADVDTTGSKGPGSFWSVPYIHTAVRLDRDKADQPCHVYDILFNTQALQMAERMPGFKGLMAQTALESVEENGKTNLKDPKTGEWDYSVLKNMKYKGNIVRPHKMKKDPKQMNKAPQKSKPKQAEPQKKKSESKPEEPAGPPKPKVTVVHRGEYDMSDSLKASGTRDLPISRRPKELIIKLELPLMASVADMQLDIKGGFLEFSLPGTYELKHKLPYPVEETAGDAKYSKTQKLLTVTLKVLPWSKEELESEVERAQKLEEERKVKEADEAEQQRLKEEQEASKAVKKGFLAKTPKDKPDQISDSKDSLPSSSDQSDISQESQGTERSNKPLIQDLGECTPEQKEADVASVAQKLSQLNLEVVDGGVPSIRFRQNQQNVSAVVRVQGIEESSLKVDYEITRVSMQFTAVADNKRQRYRHVMHLASDIEPVHCRHDLSESNLVLVLRKSQSAKWDAFEGPEREPPAAIKAKPDSEAEAPAPPAAPGGASEQETSIKNSDATKDKRRVRWDDQVPDAPLESRKIEQPVQAKDIDPGEFQPAEDFAGSRPGFVFKMGEHGLGYYKDAPAKLDYDAGSKVAEAQDSADADEVRAGQSASENRPAEKPVASQSNVSSKPLPKIEFTNNLMFDLD